MLSKSGVWGGPGTFSTAGLSECSLSETSHNLGEGGLTAAATQMAPHLIDPLHTCTSK